MAEAPQQLATGLALGLLPTKGALKSALGAQPQRVPWMALGLGLPQATEQAVAVPPQRVLKLALVLLLP